MYYSRPILIFVISLLFLGGTSGQDRQLFLEVDATGDARTMIEAHNTNSSSLSVASLILKSGSNGALSQGVLTSFATTYSGLPGYGGFFEMNNDDSGILLRSSDQAGVIRFLTGGSTLSTNTRMIINFDGNIGIGTNNPVSKLQVGGGNLYLSDNSGAVILTAPDSTCWSLTVDNSGTLSTTSIPCP